jgi:hypothetical protein
MTILGELKLWAGDFDHVTHGGSSSSDDNDEED